MSQTLTKKGVQITSPPVLKSTELVSKLVSAGLAACVAEAITLPMDTAKIKLQVEGGTLMSTMRTIAAADGMKGFFRGLVPGLHRQLGFCTIRLGLYDTTKDFYMKNTPLNEGLPLRFAAGISTAVAAVCIAQPTEVVKIRMQAAKSGTVRYSGTLAAYYKIAVTEGTKGLWSGLGPNITRLSICNIGEVVTYDTVKTSILRRGWMEDAFPLHFTSAVCAGFVTTTLTSPVDVVKTRYVNSSPGEYRSAVQCARVLAREGGSRSSIKGACQASSE
ncbi:hypothetical protein ACHWQZ_G012223 [Mnemiopsis leidyi]